ncbi:hypothetical protein G7Y89_g3714 [Cudoniella acicularis]|uniref:Uncharacterized protein n=1 Tax=Cudoniella acicularis TaxID=354080 RepID=A0A8H4RQV0_9HELO|nr:hypothetical protein G7Y89_g3714 [Cudoniella acicularis]
MYFTQIAVLALAAISVTHASPISSRENDRPDEMVYLINCDRFQGDSKTPNGIKDQFLYFEDLEKSLSDGRGGIARAIAGDNGRHDGMYSHIDWTLAKEDTPLHAEFPQGEFKVWGLAEKGDPKTNITGVAELGGRDFRCYDWPRFHLSQNGGGVIKYSCTARYMCFRAERLVRQTKFNVFDTTITIPISGGADMKEKDTRILDDVKAAFHKLEQAAADNTGDTHGYQIGDSDFNLYFDIERAETPKDAHYDPNRIKNIAKMLADNLAPELYKNQTIRNCRASIIGLDPICEHRISWPAKIKVQVQFATQALQNWVDQDIITIRVGRDPAKVDTSCKKTESSAAVLSGLFNAGGALTGGVASAVSMGLGGVFGGVAIGTCEFAKTKNN